MGPFMAGLLESPPCVMYFPNGVLRPEPDLAPALRDRRFVDLSRSDKCRVQLPTRDNIESRTVDITHYCQMNARLLHQNFGCHEAVVGVVRRAAKPNSLSNSK